MFIPNNKKLENSPLELFEFKNQQLKKNQNYFSLFTLY